MNLAVFVAMLRIASLCPIIDVNPSEIFWHAGAVVYAEVADVKPDESSGILIRLKPFATLSGQLDPAFQGEIPAHAIIDSYSIKTSEIKKAPAKGAMVLAVVVDTRTADGTQIYWVPNGQVKFLAGHVGIVEVKGFDDPKVTETIENFATPGQTA